MAILDLYAKGTNTGAAPAPGSGLPTAAGTTAKLAYDSQYDRRGATTTGRTYLDTVTAIQKAGSNTSADPIVAHALANHTFTPKRYMNGVFDRINTNTNSMVSKATGQNATILGPGNFSTDLVPYTERVFSQQAINAGMATPDRIVYSAYQATSVAVAPSPTQVASTIVPIVTPTQPSTISTVSGMGSVVDDGRYTITVGWGFVQYGNLTNGGYSS